MTSAPFRLAYWTLDVFTATRFHGNPLAVVVIPGHQRALVTQETKQRIAREFNLSETVFIHVPWLSGNTNLLSPPPADVTHLEIDIFSIEGEIPFSGHPVIGTAHFLLKHLGWSETSNVRELRTKVGAIPILRLEGGTVRAATPHAVHRHRHTLGEAMRTSTLVQDQVTPFLNRNASIREAEERAPLVSIVKGMTFLLINLVNPDDLALVKEAQRGLDFGKVPGLLDEGPWYGGFCVRYYYHLESRKNDEQKVVWKARARMVEMPTEDPASGSAACALACYLAGADETGTERPLALEVTQGVEMGRRSEMVVEVVPEVGDGGIWRIKDVHLGGEAVVVMEGTLAI
ncbi:hypothetical protein GE09DRAFT_1066296 [Coniochaeta sp. 2T2.1]|nr:hypothetical protein GE09DRAFT_1066296 [Coniochaeta sp. 2T2.1]